MTTNVVERLEEEMNETSDEMYQVTVSRKDLKALIASYKELQKKVEEAKN